MSFSNNVFFPWHTFLKLYQIRGLEDQQQAECMKPEEKRWRPFNLGFSFGEKKKEVRSSEIWEISISGANELNETKKIPIY